MSASTLTEVLWPFTTPLYSGTAPAAAGLMQAYDVAINGRAYLLDLDPQQQFYGLHFNNQSIPALRSQADQGVHAGEATLTRDDLWRRSFFSFHHGAGQRWTDRSTSDEFRFRASKGVDVWTHDRLSLLSDVTQYVTASGITEMVGVSSADARLHYNDAGTWKFVRVSSAEAVTPTVTAVTLPTSADYCHMVSTGTDVYAINWGTFQIYKSALGTGTPTLFASPVATVFCIGYAHGRLLSGSGRVLQDCTTGTPVTVGTLTDPDETWYCFAEGTKVIYGAANTTSTRQSHIYSITYDPTTAALGTPVVAGLMPVGEQIRTIYGYLGFLFVGTTKGFRMCRQATDGSLTVGPLIPIAGGVQSFTALAQYVYFAWSNFDTTSAGIGRIDVSTFTEGDLIPAYASDLMGTVTGTVCGLTTADNANPTVNAPRPWFVVTGANGGIYGRHPTNLVASGTLDTGLAAFGFPEGKDAAAIDVRHEPLVGSVAASLSSNEGAFVTVDVSNVQGSSGYLMATGHRVGSRHEIRVTLTQQTATTGPALTSLSLFVYPSVQRGDVWTVPLLIPDDGKLLNQSIAHYDFWAEYTYFKGLAAARTPSTFQVGTQTYTVYVDDYKVGQLRRADNAPGGWWGSIVLTLKNLERVSAA